MVVVSTRSRKHSEQRYNSTVSYVVLVIINLLTPCIKYLYTGILSKLARKSRDAGA